MSSTKTPDTKFFVRFNGEKYIVLPLYHRQATRMREAGVKHIYDTSAQAYTVCRKLNVARKEKDV